MPAYSVPRPGNRKATCGSRGGGRPVEQPARIAPLQHADSVLAIAAGEHAAVAERAAPDLEGVGDVGEIGQAVIDRLTPGDARAAGRSTASSAVSVRAESTSRLQGGAAAAGCRSGRLLQDHVRVDAADARRR